MLRVDAHYPFSNTSFRPVVKTCFLNVASIIRVFWNTKDDNLRHCHVEILWNILYSKRHVSNYHVIGRLFSLRIIHRLDFKSFEGVWRSFTSIELPQKAFNWSVVAMWFPELIWVWFKSRLLIGTYDIDLVPRSLGTRFTNESLRVDTGKKKILGLCLFRSPRCC